MSAVKAKLKPIPHQSASVLPAGGPGTSSACAALVMPFVFAAAAGADSLAAAAGRRPPLKLPASLGHRIRQRLQEPSEI
jgi:hypothetical protein